MSTQATEPSEFEALARQADVIASWHGGNRGAVVKALADALWEKAGGRKELPPGDPDLATPGPGVRAAAAEPVEVDSVGQIEEAPQEPTPVTPAPAHHARKQTEAPKPPTAE